MSRFALVCFCAFVFGLAPAGAQTAPSPAPAVVTAPSPEAVKIVSALSKVQSFRAQMSSPSGVAGTITFVMLPARRTKAVVAFGSMLNEMVAADGQMYTRTNGGDWTVAALPANGGGLTPDAAMKSMTDATRFRMLPDRVENGTTVGAYEMSISVPPGAPAGTVLPPLSCTYDKTTYLPRTCTIQTMTQTFEGWNDPANVVEIPVVASPRP
jgi:hypothetical protein